MKKIEFLIDNLSNGGAQAVLLNVAAELKGNYSDVSFTQVNPITSNEHNTELVNKVSARFLTKNFKPYKLLYAFICYFITVTRKKPDVIIACLPVSTIFALCLKIILRSSVTVIIREVNTVSVRTGQVTLKKRLLQFIINLLYKKADMIIAPSFGVKNDLVRYLKMNENSVRVIHNPLTKKNDLAVTDSALPDKFICGAGRLVHAKGFDFLIKAFAEICFNNTDVSLVIIGEGEEKDKLEKLCDDYSIRDRVFFTGHVANVLPLIKRAEVFVLSSRWEGMPNILIEAMSAGTKLVAFDCLSGPREILDNGQLGFLAEPGSVDSLAQGIKVMLTSEVVSYTKKLKQFDIVNITQQYHLLISEVIKKC